MRELIDKYVWADEDENLVLTLAVVTGSSVSELVRVYGGGDIEPVLLNHDDAWVPQKDFGSYFHVQTLTEGLYTVAIEPNGWTGSLPRDRASRVGWWIVCQRLLEHVRRPSNHGSQRWRDDRGFQPVHGRRVRGSR